MGSVFTPVDFVVFLVLLIVAMVIGLIAGRREETSEDYFLAGRQIPWWGVAGSIFGSNVSANHMVGMMGIGFSIGFAQSHFELGAIAGLMMLCYGFLPVYRKLRIYTLSEYMERRYDQRSRIAYALIMLFIMAVIHMSQGLYIGARSSCVLLGGAAMSGGGQAETTAIAPAEPGDADATNRSAGTDSDSGPATVTPREVNSTYYVWFVLLLGLISASYTVFGGLKAVVWTDVIQSVLMLIAGILVAAFVFHAVGGWSEMMALDQAERPNHKMRLYLPMNHSQLPWTGVFTGLIAMHCFYWGTNQFIVQRALGARSDNEAKVGIIAAGFLKLLIPFFAIASGVAGYYYFSTRAIEIAPDTAFVEVVKRVVPLGVGIVGLIAAGLIGAILSSIDSMMNSAATIFTIDIYQRYLKPEAGDKEMILVGRLFIVAMVVLAAAIAIWGLDPNSNENFFLNIANYQNYLTPGVLVAFLAGMFWKRGTATAGLVVIIGGIFFSWAVETGYDRGIGDSELASNRTYYALVIGEQQLSTHPELAAQLPDQLRNLPLSEIKQKIEEKADSISPLIAYLGPRLNFFHRVVAVILLCSITYVLVSLMGKADPEKSRLSWTDLGGHNARVLRQILTAIALSITLYIVLTLLRRNGVVTPMVAGLLAAAWTTAMFWGSVVISRRDPESELVPLYKEDRLWAGLLSGTAMLMLFYFV